MLTAVEIRRRALVEDGTDTSYRAVSYDLRVGEVVMPGGDLADFYVIPPQGIVEVVSQERVRLPGDVAGFAMVKTSLSNQGMLALNIGIVDPLYVGKIGSFFVNFGKREHVIRKGDVFLRLVFHETQGELAGDTALRVVPDADYLAAKRANMRINFGSEFLDIGRITERYAEEAFAKFRTRVLGYVAVAAFILAVMTFLLNFGNLLLVNRWLVPNDASRAELLKDSLERGERATMERSRRQSEVLLQLETQLRATSEQLGATRARLEALERRTAPPLPRAPASEP